MINRRRIIIIVKLLITLLILILIGILAKRITVSRYETEATATADIQAAFYLLKDDYQNMTIKLPTLEPREEAYKYAFSISNNDTKKGIRTETALEYDLQIVTTTNLPLIYELYLNGDYSKNIILTDEIKPDEYGTFFKTITTEKRTFGYKANETDTYQLVIYFPETYISTKYQDMIEAISIKINSRQLIEEGE